MNRGPSPAELDALTAWWKAQRDKPDLLTLLGYALMPVYALAGIVVLIENPWLLLLLAAMALSTFAYFAWENARTDSLLAAYEKDVARMRAELDALDAERDR